MVWLLFCLISAAFAAVAHRELVLFNDASKGYDNQLAIICGNANEEGRIPIILWKGLGTEPFSSTINVPRGTLTHYNGRLYEEAEKDDFETAMMQFEPKKPTAALSDVYSQYGSIIERIGSPDQLLSDGVEECKCQLVGGAIQKEYGKKGMIEVIDFYLGRRYRRTVERCWDRIGYFYG